MRFSIRDVIWLTVVVALGVGWWLDHRGQVKQQEQLTEFLLRTEDIHVSPWGMPEAR